MPTVPDECTDITLTANGELLNSCISVTNSYFDILGNTIELNVETITTPGSCTQVVTPYSRTFDIGSLAQGSYEIEFYEDGILVSTETLTVSSCTATDNHTIGIPNNPDACDDITLTAGGDLLNSCVNVTNSSSNVVGNVINLNVETFTSPGICTQVVTPYTRFFNVGTLSQGCLLYTSPSPRDATLSRMPSSA